MENLLETNSQDNSDLIYEHAEKSIEKVNKSIDNVTSKLTSSLGFSGLLLKFAADMPSESYLFLLKICVTILLMVTVALCGCGLYTRASGEELTTRYLRYSLYYENREEIRRKIIDERVDAIDQLEELAAVRRMFLNYALTCLIAAVTSFGLSIIVQSFLKAST